jgi:hypothetical protein
MMPTFVAQLFLALHTWELGMNCWSLLKVVLLGESGTACVVSKDALQGLLIVSHKGCEGKLEKCTLEAKVI